MIRTGRKIFQLDAIGAKVTSGTNRYRRQQAVFLTRSALVIGFHSVSALQSWLFKADGLS